MSAGADEISVIEQWLYERLTADSALAALGVHADEVPEDESLPAIVYQFRGGADRYGVGIFRVWADVVYLVKAVNLGRSTIALAPSVRKVFAQLQGQSGTAGDGTVFMCRRDGPYKHAAYVDGRYERHLGAYYRLYARDND